MSKRRVVVTGLGCISPVGNTVEAAWANLLAGQTGIGRISKFDATAFASQVAGEVKGFQVEDYMSAKEARTMDTFIHYGIAAAVQAVQDAGLPTGEALSDEQAVRIGCNIGSGIGGLPLIEATGAELNSRGPRRITPFFVPATIINMISGHVSMRFGYKGPNIAVVTACTPVENGFDVVLDQTVLFPEGGGQPSDTGTIGEAAVQHVREENGEIYHRVDRALPVGGPRPSAGPSARGTE